MMFTTITLSAVLVWFVWGFFMGAGWFLANWLLAHIFH